MKRFLSIILSISMTLGLFVNPVFASETDYTSEPQISAESSQIEAEGKDSAGQMIADAISKQAAEQNSDSACHISGLTIDKENMTAEVSFVTDEDAEVMVSIFAGTQSTLYASGKQKVTPAEHSTTVKIACRDGISSMPDTFTGKAYLLDRDSHEPLCDPFTTSEYTKEIMDLKASTTEDFPEDRVLNLDSDTETNFAVYSDEISVIEENAGKNQITDNGDGTYTVTNADSSFTSLNSGDKLSYTDSDGNVLLLTVSKISVNGSTVTIWKETKEEDLTDYFDYLKIEATDQNVPLDIDESTMDEGVEFLGCDIDTQGELPAAGAEGEGSLSHSLAFQIKKKIHKTEDDKAGVDIKGELNLQLKSTLKYYLSANYQMLLFKIDCSISVSGEISGKLEEKLPLARVEIPILPCVSAGFTPAFVVRGTGAVKWTLEWKETVGVSYDTKNGCRDAGEAPTTTAKAEISKTIFVGIEATPYVCIVNENLCKTSLETSAGIEVKRTQSGDLDNTKIHKCKDCIAGSVKCKVTVKAKMDLVKGTVSMEAVLASLEVKLFDYYRSATYNESGYGSCPHVYYKTKISVDDKSGTAVPQAWITPMKVGDNGPAAVKFLTDKDSPEITSVAAGTDGTAVVYLQKGDYVFHAKTDELSCKKEAEIKARSEYTNEVNLTMDTRTYPVTVKVQDGSGNPVSDMTFYEKDPETGKSLTVEGKTDTDGNAEIRLPLGTHTIEARNSSYKGSGEITVTKETSTLTITVEEIKYGTINLIALDGDRNVVSGAAISGGNLSAFLRTDSSGRANFRAEVGPLTIHVKKDKASGDAAVEVVEGTQDVTVVLDAYEVTIHAEDESGNPVKNAVVAGLNLEEKIVTDTNGDVKLMLPAGEQFIQVYTDTMFGYTDILIGTTKVSVKVTMKKSTLFWILNEDELRIFGNGEMNVYSENTGVPWSKFKQNIKKVIIEDGVTSIGKYAFAGSSVENIVMPASLKIIEYYAFGRCTNLKNIIIPNSVETIDICAFQMCSNLKSINLPDSLLTIGTKAFENCSSLETITIPKQVTVINDKTFSGCSNLREITLPEGLDSIGGMAFNACTLLEKLSIPDTVTYIGSEAFYWCRNLREIKLSESITCIRYRTFGSCSSLQSIVVPDSVKTVEKGAFEGCGKLESISVSADTVVETGAVDSIQTTIIRREVTSSAGTGEFSPEDTDLPTEEGTPATSEPEDISESILTDEDNEEAVSGEDISDSEEVIPETEADTEDTTEANTEATEQQETSAPAADFSDISDDPEATVTVMEKETYGAQARVAVKYWNDLLETNLVPGERYLMVYVCRKDEDDLLNSKNVYYMDQKTADEDGTILFKYPLMVFASGPSAPTRTDPEIYVYGPSAENNLSDANVEISPLTENGTWQSPEIEVGYRGKYLTEDVDYRVSGDLNVNEAGEYSVLIKGRGNYSGRIRVYFTVNEKDDSEDPADHEHRYTASYQWEKTADGKMSCTVIWDCTVNNCGAESVTDADVTRTGTYCTGFIYKASAVLDGVMYTDTYREAGAGHSWTSWKTVSVATVFQATRQTRTCQRCKTSENRTSGSKLKPTIQTNTNSFPLKVKQTTTKLKVTGLAAGDRIVSWKSSNPKILTVTANGKLKAGKKTGKATLTITLASGLKKQIKVKVQKKAVKTTKISVPRTRIVIKKGRKQQLKPVITPITSLQKITFSSSNKKIVSVNKKGQITARRKGRAKITIRSGSKKKVVTVTVK